jgi:hypothetical protein
MKKLMLPLASLGFVVMASEAVQAACALYAREYANQMVQEGAAPGMTVSVQDQAYYRCLNRDEEPAMPTASAYFGADLIGGPALLAPIAEGDISVNDEEPVAPKPRPAPAVVTATAGQTSPGSRSRRVPWTPEWVAWCSSHFPNSFDLKNGTVIPYKTNRREFCN